MGTMGRYSSLSKRHKRVSDALLRGKDPVVISRSLKQRAIICGATSPLVEWGPFRYVAPPPIA